MRKSFQLSSQWPVRKLTYIILWLFMAGLALHLYKSIFLDSEPSKPATVNNTVRETVDITAASISTKEDNLRTKVVLYWTTFHRAPDFYMGFGKMPFQLCPVSNCVSTNNRSQLSISDALLFHPSDIKFHDMPPFRFEHQKWIWFDHESPIYCHRPQYPPNVYNWTMTYRLDSDITDGYGKVVPFSSREKLQVVKTISIVDLESFRTLKESSGYDTRFDYDSFVKNKTKSIAWVVSHCPTQSKRETYVRELSKYIDVHIYGRCGNLTCERGISCMARLGREYKFYLAFENSLCVDYITEKFFNALKFGMVPIVFGIDAHKSLGPSNGYIDALQFESPKALAEFLHQVVKNDTIYQEYLKWNDVMRLVENKGWCKLCKMLNDPTTIQKKTVYHSIDAWWFDENKCFQPTW